MMIPPVPSSLLLPPPPLLCAPNSLSCLDSVSLGQHWRLWESKLGVTLQVRPVWDTGGDSGIRGAAVLGDLGLARPTSKGGRRDRLCPEFCSLASRAAFLTPAELLKHRGYPSSPDSPPCCFCHGAESGQRPDVATAATESAQRQ